MVEVLERIEAQSWKRCDTFTKASFDHILFTCTKSANKRNDLWRKVLGDCPGQLGYELERMSIPVKTSFVLNAMNNSYINEWHNCFASLATFIHDMWYWYSNDDI